ncbi:hypothetical protein [Dokdonella sp.]|uniref:hypothetical protein n=1 Tax=Dokdonella sp. TaxID=2291710 RepID=UPI002C972206|nr:hypothetical protein [Dokdonella sp.]HOX73039.1 hypothetical protein [Dokdonella sp.]HPN80731.1 hypothetical protein [Dokdonella sp.]
MRRHLHTIALVLLVLVFLFDLVLWGAVPGLPEVGGIIERSANSEAILASIYISLGGFLDGAVAGLNSLGSAMMTDGLGDGFARMIEDPSIAMDLILASTYNRTHGWIKTLYWATPVLSVTFLLLWLVRPKKVDLIRKR